MSIMGFILKYRWFVLTILLGSLFASQFVFVTVDRKLELKTVDYYKGNQQARETTLKECRQKAINRLADTPEAQNCRAAETAQQDLLFTHKDPREGKTYQFDFGAPEVGAKAEQSSNQVR
jgi:hypothetical protein